MKSILILLLVCACVGCSDSRFEKYRANHNCKFAGVTPDMNGANTGGISSVFRCDNGKYYVVYGGARR